MSDFNISSLLSGENNKGGYISSEQVEKYEGEACINDQPVPEKKVIGNFTGFQEKKRYFFT